MAYKVTRINPLDLQPGVAVGVSLPFNGPSVFNSTYTTRDQIKSNLINFLLTNQDERVFNPSFGLGLRRKLFEQIATGTVEDIKDFIREGISNYFPQIRITNIEANSLPDYNVINIVITYAILETNITDRVSLNFE